jgi:hypothetical protein
LQYNASGTQPLDPGLAKLRLRYNIKEGFVVDD